MAWKPSEMMFAKQLLGQCSKELEFKASAWEATFQCVISMPLPAFSPTGSSLQPWPIQARLSSLWLHPSAQIYN